MFAVVGVIWGDGPLGGAHQELLGDRQVIGPPVDLSRARIHDARGGIVRSAGFQQRHVRDRVHTEIQQRVAHAVNVADLPGEVEDDLLVLHQEVHRALVADVGDVHPYVTIDAVDVVQVAAVVGDERIDQQHVGAQDDELPGEVASDEAQTTGDHHPAAAVEVEIAGVGHFRSVNRSAAICSETSPKAKSSTASTMHTAEIHSRYTG